MWNDTVIEAIRHTRLAVLDLGHLDLGHYVLDTASARRTAIDGLIGKLKYLPQAQRTDLTERIAASAAVAPSTSLMMTSPQVRELRHAGMQIGAHTVSHPILTRLLPPSRRGVRWLTASRGSRTLLGERGGLRIPERHWRRLR